MADNMQEVLCSILSFEVSATAGIDYIVSLIILHYWVSAISLMLHNFISLLFQREALVCLVLMEDLVSQD